MSWMFVIFSGLNFRQNNTPNLFAMNTASDSHSAHVQSVDSVLDCHSWIESPERDGVLSLVSPEFGAVMGSASWPALSEPARASTKASSTDSLTQLSVGSTTLSKAMSDDSLFSHEVVATNSASNRESPSRQWSPELGGGSLSHRNKTANGSFSQAPNSQSSVVEASPFNPLMSSSSSGVFPRDDAHRGVGQRGGSHSGYEPHHPRGPFRRNNSGPQLQVNGSSNHSHGGKRDQEHWKHDWSNNHRFFGSRVDLAPQQGVASRPFIRGPVSNAPFIPPPRHVALQPSGPPAFYNDPSSFMHYAPGPHPGSLGHMPMVPFAPMFIPDPHLPSKIVRQIDYYFSDDNLVKDPFLRQKMDVDGWVPINLIANFNKIRELTNNVQLILDALRASNMVEIQQEKVRRKGTWRKWILPTILYPTGSSPQSLSISSLHIHDENTTT